MKISRTLTAALATLAVSLTLGCASTNRQAGTGEYFDDSVITTKVKAAIFEEPGLKSAEINVETFKGTVQLSGFVGNPGHVSRAGELARGVRGVSNVKNDIRIK
jgi:osmotically-inducible protein OsmY